jgi:hypothetical protein
MPAWRAFRGGLAAAILVLAGRPPDETPVVAALEEFDRACRRPLWPGFEPCRIPLAIFDGRRTWLARHPSPPPEFTAWTGGTDIRVFEGRHDSLRANTAAEIEGISTATVTVEGPQEPRRLAGLLIHEAFHVFQARRHPKWGGNEVDLFVYPLDDAGALALRRLESAALSRALEAGNRERTAAWGTEAVELRRERFGLLPGPAAAYERGTEAKEGLARYVERLAASPAEPVFPPGEFPAEAIRERAYASGAAVALLLDRLDPGWKTRLEASDDEPLDELLARAVAGTRPAVIRAGEREEARRRAMADTAALDRRRTELRREFLEAPGWRVIVEAQDPLFPQNFDPWNVQRLSGSVVLHTRWIKLGNALGNVEVLGHPCLTESAGKHPLFEGVRRATIGLPSEPSVVETPEAVKISAEGVTLEFRGARLSRVGRAFTVVLPRSPDRSSARLP